MFLNTFNIPRATTEPFYFSAICDIVISQRVCVREVRVFA